MGQISSRIARWSAAIFGSLIVVSAVGLQPAAAVDFFPDQVCNEGSSSTVCSAEDKDNISGTDGIILRAATLMSVIAGIAAVIMIIIGGFMFVTAGGDTNRVSTAKKTLAYAVVGLIVIALARMIVGFVVTRVG